MRFWQKIYLYVLIVFLISMDFAAYAMINKSYEINKQMETTRAISQFHNIDESLSYITDSYGKNVKNGSLKEIIGGFAQNYANYGFRIEVYDKEECIYSDGFEMNIDREELKFSKANAVYRKVNGELYVFTGGKMTFKDYMLVVTSNADYLQKYNETLIKYFITLSIILTSILSVVLIFILKSVTKPINKLSYAVKQIAGGAYDKRVKVGSKDEVGELGENFNKMAEAISFHIEKLKNFGEEREHFINNLTHELKTPITAIKGYSQFINNANCNDEEKRLAVDYITEHTDRLNILSNKLMELLYLKHETYCPQKIDVGLLFSYVSKIETYSLEQKKMKLIIKNEAQWINGVETLLQTLLINLIENSIKASKEGSEIFLSSYVKDKELIIEILDHGMGIPENEIEKISEAFYTIDKSRSKANGGIGLGMAICKEIVSLHGGEMHISSVQNESTKVALHFTTNLQLNE